MQGKCSVVFHISICKHLVMRQILTNVTPCGYTVEWEGNHDKQISRSHHFIIFKQSDGISQASADDHVISRFYKVFITTHLISPSVFERSNTPFSNV